VPLLLSGSGTGKASIYLCAFREVTPNPALEALACGLPVIFTPVGKHAGDSGERPKQIAGGAHGGGLRPRHAADAEYKSSDVTR